MPRIVPIHASMNGIGEKSSWESMIFFPESSKNFGQGSEVTFAASNGGGGALRPTFNKRPRSGLWHQCCLFQLYRTSESSSIVVRVFCAPTGNRKKDVLAYPFSRQKNLYTVFFSRTVSVMFIRSIIWLLPFLAYSRD